MHDFTPLRVLAVMTRATRQSPPALPPRTVVRRSDIWRARTDPPWTPPQTRGTTARTNLSPPNLEKSGEVGLLSPPTSYTNSNAPSRRRSTRMSSHERSLLWGWISARLEFRWDSINLWVIIRDCNWQGNIYRNNWN